MITKKIMELDPELVIHNEGEWSGTELKYSAFNDGGVECEVGEFLYGLVRMIKPERVLETGTHYGIGATYIGHALKENGFGHLETLEFLPEIREFATKRLLKQDLMDFVTLVSGDATKYVPNATYDVIFLDTEPQTRFFELTRYYKSLNEGGYFFIHDLHRHMHQIPNAEHGFAWPYGKIPNEMHRFVGGGFLRPFHFGTPRGLTGFYKVHSGDYKWPIQV